MKRKKSFGKIGIIVLVVIVAVFAMTVNFVSNNEKTGVAKSDVTLVQKAEAANICAELYFGIYQCCKVKSGSCQMGSGAVYYGPIYY